MWTPQFQANDQLHADLHGLLSELAKQPALDRALGDLIAFHSLFFVEPQQKIVSVCFLQFGRKREDKARPEILNFFSDRYFPGAPKVEFLKTPASELRAIEGMYQSTSRADSTKLKLDSLSSQRRQRWTRMGRSHRRCEDLRGHPDQMEANWERPLASRRRPVRGSSRSATAGTRLFGWPLIFRRSA